MSAKDDINVKDTFTFLGREIKDKILSGDQAIYAKSFVKGSKIVSSSETKTSKGSSCC